MGFFDDLTEDIDWGDVGKAVGGAVGGPAGSIIGGYAGNKYDDYSGNLPDADRPDDWESSFTNDMIRVGASTYMRDRSERKNNEANDARYSNRYVEMADAARKAGINPLEALRSGGGQNVSRIGTTAGMENQFDQIDAILSGQQAADRAQEKLNRDLTRVQIDEARRGGLPQLGNSNGSSSPAAPDGFNPDGSVVRGDPALRFGIHSLEFPGVSDSNAVEGTVPYVGMTGQAVPGPNAENQMGIDEVLGWVAMEAASASVAGANWSADRIKQDYQGWRRHVIDEDGSINWLPKSFDAFIAKARQKMAASIDLSFKQNNLGTK